MNKLYGIKALAFDAYGTIFDVHSVVALANKMYPGKGEELSRLWRSKQMEYMFLRTVMGRYIPHGENNEAALIYAMKFLKLNGGIKERALLINAYETLELFDDAKRTIPMLSNFKKSILSVGTPALIRRLVENAGIESNFEELLSVDEVKVYKPHPRTYQLIIDKLQLLRQEVGFVTSNYYDVIGAKAFGFQAIWINRNNVIPDELGLCPNVELKSMDLMPNIFG